MKMLIRRARSLRLRTSRSVPQLVGPLANAVHGVVERVQFCVNDHARRSVPGLNSWTSLRGLRRVLRVEPLEPKVLLTTGPADLSIAVSDDPDPVAIGATLEYSVAVQNLGPADADNVVVTDLLPAGVSFVSDSLGICKEAPADTLTCPLGTLDADATEFFSIDVAVNSPPRNGVYFINNVAVSSDSSDPDTDSNRAAEETLIARLVDLEVTKTESVDPVVAGSGSGNLTYHVRVENKGPSNASGVELSESITLPAGVTIDSITPSGTTSYAPANAANGTWTVGDLARDESETLTVVLTVDATTTAGIDVIGDTATVIEVNEHDPNPTNDSAAEWTSVAPHHADLSITKLGASSSVQAGAQLRYTVIVDNAGPNDAQNVVVTDTLPARVSYQSDSSGCVVGPVGTLSCPLGTIPAGHSASFVITVIADVTLSNGTVLVNNAAVSSSTPDPNLGNNSASEDTTIVACLCNADRFEPNDTFNTARDMGTADQTHDQLTVHQPGNDDWYKWTSSYNGRLVVDVEFVTQLGDLDLQLYDANGKRIDSSDSVTNDERVETAVLAGEMFIIHVLGFGGAFQPDYTLNIDGPEPPEVTIVEVEPDPRPATVDDPLGPAMVEAIQINFTEAVTGFDLSDLTLTRTTKGPVSLLPGSAQLTTTDNIHWVLANLGGLTDGSGFYQLVVTASGSGIEDVDQNPLVAGAQDSWSTRPGDVNEDGVFDQFDLVIVQIRGKYTTTDSGESADWTQGEWNGDGLFDQEDIMLALQTGIYRDPGMPSIGRRPSAPDSASDEALAANAPQLRAEAVDALLPMI